MRRAFYAVAAWLLAVPVSIWAGYHERRILRSGRPLSAGELQDARSVGVRRPQRVRVLAVEKIPNPILWSAGLVGRFTRYRLFAPAGLTLRYGIFVIHRAADDQHLLAHELAHTMQYERAGGRFRFLRRYIFQCLADGYSAAEWELEAHDLSTRCRK